MRLSARNQLSGTVKSINEGQVVSEVRVTLVGGTEVVSVITTDSLRTLELKEGDPVIVVIKSTEVLLATES